MTVNHDVVGSSPTGGVQISLLDVGLAFFVFITFYSDIYVAILFLIYLL